MTCKIITTFVHPPIPDRRFDWCAYYDGEEELCRYGRGKTELEAVGDLLAIYPVEESCDICGDLHEPDNIPLSCKTGDGE